MQTGDLPPSAQDRTPGGEGGVVSQHHLIAWLLCVAMAFICRFADETTAVHVWCAAALVIGALGRCR